MTPHHGEVHRRASNVQPRRVAFRLRVILRSPETIRRGRASTFGPRSSSDAVDAPCAFPRDSRANVGRKGILALSSGLVHAFDTTLAWLGQKLDRIGGNGIMVIRLRVACWRDAGPCRFLEK